MKFNAFEIDISTPSAHAVSANTKTHSVDVLDSEHSKKDSKRSSIQTYSNVYTAKGNSLVNY